MTAEPTTTIKVPKALRDRIAQDAAREGRTAAGLIADRLDDHDRRLRFAAVRRAYERSDAAYLAETEQWDGLASEGLGP